MGKQILFYMTEDDENEFVDFIRSTGDVIILPQTCETSANEEFLTFRDLAGRKLGEACHLWNRSISPEPLIKHIPQQGYYWLDFMVSEVVNVMRSKATDKTLSLGRLHIEDKVSCPNGTFEEKRAAFLAWFENVCKWIRAAYPATFDGARLSPRAQILAKSGVELIGHQF